MAPASTFCPPLACPARGPTGPGTIGIHSRKEPRFLCTECRKPFTATTGPALSRLRTSAETVSRVVTRMAHECPLHALVVACGYDERTVACWRARAGVHGQAVQEQLVEQARDLGHVQAEAIRGKQQGASVWMALALMVKTRVWLAGDVRVHREMTLLRRLSARVRRGALPPPLLCGPDGVCASIRAIRETCRDPVQTGVQGRPRWRPWHHRCIAPVGKRDVQRRVVAVERRLSEGRPARVERLRRRSHGDGGSTRRPSSGSTRHAASAWPPSPVEAERWRATH
jgi:transposase-like protein